MSNCRANSASVLSPLTAARATFALKAGEWFRRGRLVIVSPGLQLSWLLSGRNSTYPAVQTFKASSFATGAAALGTFLVLGFTLHNVTEGIGIVAPLVQERPRWPAFVGLAALAGLPAVVGIWLGSYAYSPHWAALALAVGAGAILQVIVEVGGLLMRRAKAQGVSWASTSAVLGVVLGVAVMYGTALLVQA
jgi:hypothetical protein